MLLSWRSHNKWTGIMRLFFIWKKSMSVTRSARKHYVLFLAGKTLDHWRVFIQLRKRSRCAKVHSSGVRAGLCLRSFVRHTCLRVNMGARCGFLASLSSFTAFQKIACAVGRTLLIRGTMVRHEQAGAHWKQRHVAICLRYWKRCVYLSRIWLRFRKRGGLRRRPVPPVAYEPHECKRTTSAERYRYYSRLDLKPTTAAAAGNRREVFLYSIYSGGLGSLSHCDHNDLAQRRFLRGRGLGYTTTSAPTTSAAAPATSATAASASTAAAPAPA